jgi:hypothetical protein
VSLSSPESETYAAASAAMDAILITTIFLMATSMSHHDVFVFGFISCKRCAFWKRCRSFKAFELQSSMASRPCDAETFTCQSSDGCTEPTSQPNVLAQQGSNLCATSWASGEETIWREPMIQETSSDMSQIRDSKVTVNHKSTF